MISDKRITEATKKAMGWFWESVAKSFPEAESGDLSPWTTIKFEKWAAMAVREWAEANAGDLHRDDVSRVTIPGGSVEVIHVSPDVVAAVEAELGPSDPDIWCLCDDAHVPVEYHGDNECDFGIEKHHYHCSVCGGVRQVS